MSEDILVTGSHAIFHSDGGLVVPGSVVGFQFQHSQLVKRFMEITGKTNVKKISYLDLNILYKIYF